MRWRLASVEHMFPGTSIFPTATLLCFTIVPFSGQRWQPSSCSHPQTVKNRNNGIPRGNPLSALFHFLRRDSNGCYILRVMPRHGNNGIPRGHPRFSQFSHFVGRDIKGFHILRVMPGHGSNGIPGRNPLFRSFHCGQRSQINRALWRRPHDSPQSDAE